MNKEKFWGIVDSVNSLVDYNDKEAVLKATREALCKLPLGEIVDWYAVYRALHKEAYRDDLWDAVEACGIHATDDGFIDFRAWLISRGQAFFEAVIANPVSLSKLVSKPLEANFELYGYVSCDAYAEKACREALGDAGFVSFKKEWILENRDVIEENADWNGLSVDVCKERLFYSMLVGKYDIYKNLTDKINLSLDAKLSKATEHSAQTKDKDGNGDVVSELGKGI